MFFRLFKPERIWSVEFNDTVSYQGRLVSPSSLILVWDWHCQSANSEGLKTPYIYGHVLAYRGIYVGCTNEAKLLAQKSTYRTGLRASEHFKRFLARIRNKIIPGTSQLSRIRS